KLSGEALAGEGRFGLDFDTINSICAELKNLHDLGVEVGVVIGGGNYWRGARDGGGKMERSRADYVGMMATVMNCMVVADVLEQQGTPAGVLTAIDMRPAAEPYRMAVADERMKQGRVLFFGCGTGMPYFSTDTAAALRAAELHADAILFAKKVDYVYTADPMKDPNARKIESISCTDILRQGLGVIDATAASMCRDNRIPVLLFGLNDPKNIIRAVKGEKVGTVISPE
ncbi:MAG: UMP kinase, partial [Oscillospiraceae bacterium]|nr:UMP kinase [Oscillospiraceae bacterium]